MTVWQALYAYLNTSLTAYLSGGLHWLDAEFSGAPTYPYAVLDNVGPQQQHYVALRAADGGSLRAGVDIYSLDKSQIATLGEATAQAFRELRGLNSGWHFDLVVVRDGRHLPLAMPGTYRWSVDAAIDYREA